MDFKEKIRTIPDFPEKGIMFKDVTTLFREGPAFREAINNLSEIYTQKKIDLVAAPEARGFAMAAPVAYALGAGLVLVRKPGKLPATKISFDYGLEYGKDTLEIHNDAVLPGQRVLIVDDLLATGGTALACVKLVEELGGEVVGLAFLIELLQLNGRASLAGYETVSLIKY